MNLLKIVRVKLYFFGILLMTIAFPLSKALLSISLVVLIISWLIAPDFDQRIKMLKTRKSIWVFISGILIVMAGLLYSHNLHRNVFLLFNIKISLILLPIIIGSFPVLNKKELKLLLITFSAANLLASIISTLVLFQVIPHPISDVREISIFIENIRFALLLVLNILCLGYAFLLNKSKKNRVLAGGLMLWFFIFLTLMQSLTGIVVLIFTSLILFFFFLKRIQIWLKIAFLVASLIFAISMIGLFFHVEKLYHSVHYENITQLRTTTIKGNPYFHDLSDTSRINGFRIQINICQKELEAEWKKVSSIPFDSFDLRGYNKVKNTLIYYMTSKGLKKDSSDFQKLSRRDIKNIEGGYTNTELAGIGIKARIYDLIREFDCWKKTGLPAGSVTIRLNSMEKGWQVFKAHLWIGTGYGDINDDIQYQFSNDKNPLLDEMRQNPHNQFFTIMIGSGVIGLVIFLVSLILPGIMEKKYHSYLFVISFCVVVFSFLTDDTLERMIGCVITGFFFSLFLYAIPEDINNSN